MMKRALLALTGLMAFGFSVSAFPPDQLLTGGTLFDQPLINSPWLSLDSRDRFFFSTAFGSMRTTPDYLPTLTPSEPLSMAYLSDNKNSVDRIVDLRAPSNIRFGGEIGFLYGKSTGSNGFGREDYAGYIIGTVGNDKFSITAGYYRQETSFSGPRWRR
jgi:hypothetical protein